MMNPEEPDPDDYEMTPVTDQERHQIVEVMMATAVGIMHRLIDAASQLPERDAIAHMANVWPLLCTSSASVVRDSASFPVMVYYERVRMDLVEKRFFFDGMPPRVAVMGAPIKLEMPTAAMRDLLFDDVVSDRKTTVDKLEQAPAGSTKRNKLADTLDGLEDVSLEVPVPARLFLSRLRSMCHGLQAAQTATNFTRCDNMRCCSKGRFFYKGDTPIVHCEMRSAETSGLSTATQYWGACVPRPTYEGDDTTRFCSKLCARQWQCEWYRLMPDKDVDWNPNRVYSARSKPIDDVRVHDAFEYAIERNRQVSHKIHKRRKRMRSGSCLSRADFNREMDARIEMANIDAGLLYAATIFMRLPCRRSSLRLPGDTGNWRVRAHEVNRNALIRVAQIYRQHPERMPIHDLLDTPSFFRALKTKVTTIFG
jgi:hypothetical protein